MTTLRPFGSAHGRRERGQTHRSCPYCRNENTGCRIKCGMTRKRETKNRCPSVIR